MMSNFIQTIIQDSVFLGQNNIDRWDRKDTIKNETVGGHVHDVTLMVRALIEEIFPQSAYQIKLEILTDAATHDFEEVFSGDLNHDVKYNLINGERIREVLKEFCDARLKQYFSGDTKSARMFLKSTTEQSKYSKHLIKVADWLSMAIFCQKEINMGNHLFNSTLAKCIEKLLLACDTAQASLEELGMELDYSVFKLIINIDWNESRGIRSEQSS